MSGNVNTYGITHLRHVDLTVVDFEKQRAFYKDTWGLTEVGKDGNLSYLAAEGSPEQYIIRLRGNSEKRLDLIAFGAQDRASVDALATRLSSEGLQIVSQPGELQTAGGGYGFRFFDIDGRTVEVSADVEVRQHRPIEEGEAIPVRISHAVMNSTDPNRTRDFYANHLGFMLSDSLWSSHMGEIMHFMRCNDWHHSLAIARGPHTSVHHVSFEMRGSTSTCEAPAGSCAPASRRCGVRAGTSPETTRSRTSSTRAATRWSTRLSSSDSRPTNGIRRSTTSPTPWSRTSGVPPTR
jgi:catechol 2,3-dioxygenase-like lactoylglutathione lyase family enzyme